MRLLLALDPSEDPTALVDAAITWSRRLGATLDVAFADTVPFGLSVADDPVLYAEFEAQWARVQQKHADTASAAFQRVPDAHRGTLHHLGGPPDDALVERSAGYDALLLATHGRHGLRRLWEGSVSERVVRHAKCPVVTLQLDDPSGPGAGRVMLAVDLEQDTEPATLESAATWARALGTRVDIAFVDPFQNAHILVGPTPPESWLKHLETRRMEELEALVARLPDDVRGELLYRAGNAGAAVSPLTELAESRDVALLVVCTHGRSGLAHLVLGSVAERVVRSATTPVLVLRR
ncbi:MAG: universal stress protein [Myxococcota bacterium]